MRGFLDGVDTQDSAESMSGSFRRENTTRYIRVHEWPSAYPG